MWSKLMVSASDFALNLIVALISTSGLLWLTAGVQTYHPSMPIEEIQRELAKASDENRGLQKQEEIANGEADRLEVEVKNKIASRPDLNASKERRKHAEQALARSEEEAGRLDEELRRLLLLKQELGREHRQSEQARREYQEIERQLLEKSREAGQQREKLARIKREEIQRPIVRINIVPLFSHDAREPVLVSLNQGTVTPVRDPYYSIAQLGNSQQATLVCRGGAVDLALSAGSDFQKLLSQINPQKQYVYFLVDSSSFETFRAVREELRRRDIPLGWEPMEATTLTFVSSPGDGAVTPGINQ